MFDIFLFYNDLLTTKEISLIIVSFWVAAISGIILKFDKQINHWITSPINPFLKVLAGVLAFITTFFLSGFMGVLASQFIDLFYINLIQPYKDFGEIPDRALIWLAAIFGMIGAPFLYKLLHKIEKKADNLTDKFINISSNSKKGI